MSPRKPKPKIPSSFYRINNWMGLYYAVHGLTLWLGGGALAYAIYAHTSWPLALRLAAVVPCVVFGGFGMFYMGSLGHEGFHGNMNSNRHVSMIMGMICSLGAPLFLSVGVNLYHWDHHRYTNTVKDPDYRLYRGAGSLALKLWGTVRTSIYCWQRLAKLIVDGDQVDKSFPFTIGEMRFFATLDVVLVTLATALYVGLGLVNVSLFVFLVAAPALVAQLYWCIHPYVEHGGMDDGDQTSARNCTSPFLRVVLLGYTFHLCHHLYPKVQTHKLPSLAKHLAQIGYINASAVNEPRFIGAIVAGVSQTLKA